MKIRIGKFEIQISILTFILPPLLYSLNFLEEYVVAFFSITLHEMGHMAVACLFGYIPASIWITPFGCSLSVNREAGSRGGSVWMYTAGPGVNLLIYAVASLMLKISHQWQSHLELVSSVNLYLALFNLLPAFPLDGGKLMIEVLSGRMGLLAAGRLIRRLALGLSAVIMVLGAYQLFVSSFNFSLLFIGLYMIILIRNGRMESALMNMKEILFRRTRLLKKGIYPARDLVVIKSTLLHETLKNMDYDRFHLVYLLDDDLRLLQVFTENEIMEAAAGCNESCTFETLLEQNLRKEI